MLLKEYQEELKYIFSRNTRRGFVDYTSCIYLGRDMTSFLEKAAEDFARQGMYKELFNLVNKAFVKWDKTDKDDSCGETGDFFEDVTQIWNIVYESGDSNISHAKMFAWFVSKLDGSMTDYMEDPIYDFLEEHFKTEKFLQKKMDFYQLQIEKAQAAGENKGYVQYTIEAQQQRILKCMADMKKPIEEIRAYARKLEAGSRSENLAKIELAYGNMHEAIAIYEKLAAEEDTRTWSPHNWHLKLREIYKKLGMQEKYISELRAGMIRSLGNMELWEEYKGLFPQEQWEEAREEIFSGIRIGNFAAYPWYAAEGRYDLIMDGLERCGSISEYLKKYEKPLKKLYSERVLKALEDETVAKVEVANKRSDYQRVAKLLSHMQKYPGGNERVEQLAIQFREQYKRRRAMMEELSKF